MAYTVKQVAAMSGVSVRTLHFYDETGLLKPSYHGANRYRYYEEPELLTLQQILFYRELGFELKEIQRILGRADFEKLAALQSHRKVLEKDLKRTHRLIETIDKTIEHLKGVKKMKGEEMFVGFTVGKGKDRFGDKIKVGAKGGEPIDCKISSKDTNGAMCAFEYNLQSAGPRHLHHKQDEWIYILEGDFEFYIGDKQFRLGPGESIFIPRKTPHIWRCINKKPGRVLDVFQPAGNMEEFFRKLGEPPKDLITKQQLIDKSYTEAQVQSLRKLFRDHGMELSRPRPVDLSNIER
jgi:DNA-binding transcriptional MerR regulator